MAENCTLFLFNGWHNFYLMLFVHTYCKHYDMTPLGLRKDELLKKMSVLTTMYIDHRVLNNIDWVLGLAGEASLVYRDSSRPTTLSRRSERQN